MTFSVGYSLLMAIKVVMVFILMYIFVPSRIIRFGDRETFLDRVFISLVHSNIITIGIVHLLAFAKLYETFSLLFCYLAVYILVIWIRGKSPSAVSEALGMKLVITLLDMSEGRLGLRGELSRQLSSWFGEVRNKFVETIQGAIKNPFAGLFVAAGLAVAAGIRFYHSIYHGYYGASDSYVHLAWVKYLGANQMYRDGIYAYGYHTIISAMNKFSLMDPYFIVRFIGPIAGMLLVLSVFYFTLKNFRNPYVALIAVLIYGLLTDDRFPSYIWRHSAALSQEYSAIFLLPGLHFFNLYMAKRENRSLWLAAECLALTLLIHPYVSVFLGLGYIVVFLSYPENVLKVEVLSKTVIVFVISSLAAFMPIIIGLLMGIKFHSTLGYIERNIKVAKGDIFDDTITLNFFEGNPYFLFFFISSIIILLYGIFRAIKNDGQENGKVYIFVSLSSLVTYILYSSDKLGLPSLMASFRISMLLAMLMVVTYAGAINTVDIFFKNKAILNRVKGFVTFMILLGILAFAPLKIPTVPCFEYDEAVDNYLKIKNNFPALNWTIVAPVEQYQQVLGYGWHYELIEFVKKMPGSTEIDRAFTIPTDYIFIFTEKIPLGSDKVLDRKDAVEKIPPPRENATEYYYRNVKNRTILEAKAYFWAEDYMKKHKNMEVYYEGEYLKIFMIKQDAKKPVRIFS